jgi:predicted DNA-binding protein (MmcQ/YjbR family)
VNREAVTRWCRTRPGATEEHPFGPDVVVYKVGGKIFAICDEGPTEEVSLKCDPRFAEYLRERYPGGVRPGYHLNKRHWNTVSLDGEVPSEEVEEMLGHSYTLVTRSLPRAIRDGLGG